MGAEFLRPRGRGDTAAAPNSRADWGHRMGSTTERAAGIRDDVVPRRQRIVQWGTGNVGRRALPAILDHPEMDLVGLHAFSPDKRGVDAGTLADRPLTGIVGTDDVDALLALQPDCLSYMPARIDYDVVAQFLRSGINVVTTGDFLTGTNHPAGLVNTLEAAAREG